MKTIDKDGIAIILCETELEGKYRALLQGQTILESCLHKSLAEHINSEVGLGTITNIASAKEWLRSSFLFQRIQKNPAHYALGKEDDQTWEERVDDLVMQSVARLREAQLIEGGDDAPSGELKSTEYGDIMSKVGSALPFCFPLLIFCLVLHSTVDGELLNFVSSNFLTLVFRWG